ncbi:hypothetical protein [Nocardioides sp. LML1-1-1.1]|uniref:hypothetical protein n=1 Tax=Nocardioides sp. LML1-1-1.1 TaxID=3135248 RepID=UPI0034212857
MTSSARKVNGNLGEKRGGYSSSTKLVTKLAPPPRGAAPGSPAPSKNEKKAG